MKSFLAFALSFFCVLLVGAFAVAQEPTADDLYDAARAGDVERVTEIVAAGVDVNSKTEYGSTALSYASDRGHLDVVKYLLSKEADPNVVDTFYNGTALTWAQTKGHNEILGMLFAAGAKGADKSLEDAVKVKDVQSAMAIISAGAASQPAVEYARQVAQEKELEELVQFLAENEVSYADAFELNNEQASALTGDYEDQNVKISVEAVGNRVRLKTRWGTNFLKPLSETEFEYGASNAVFKLTDGKVEQIELRLSRRDCVFKPAVEKKEPEKAEVKEKKVFAASSPESKAADLAASSNNWPGFRGNGSRGVADGQSPPLKWGIVKKEKEDADATEAGEVEAGEVEYSNLAWKTAIPGLGNSCPAIWGDRLFLTSAVNPEADNNFRIGLYGDVASVEEDFEFDFNVYCLDKNSGEIVWHVTANHAKPAVKRHAKSTHANPTVATNGKHVIAFFGSEGLYCYDMDGNLKWEKDLGVLDSGWFYDSGYQWGFGSSPVIFEGNVIVQCDIQKNSFVAAYSLESGEEVWRTERPGEIPSWSSPTVHDFGNMAMLLTHATRAARGYDARTGKELWSMKDHSEIVVPTPFVAHDLIYIASGYTPIQPIVAIRPDARGDISLTGDSLTSENIAWSTKRNGPYMPSPIVYGDYLYSCSNNGILTCYSAKEGEQVYKKRLRAPGGSLSFTASPIAGEGHLYLTAEDGRTLVVEAGPEFELVGTNTLSENVLTTPAISDGRIFIRGQQNIYAFGGAKK